MALNKDEIAMLPILRIPPKVNLKDIKANGKLLTDEQIDAIKSLNLKPGRSYSKKELQDALGLKQEKPEIKNVEFDVVVSEVEGEKRYYALYRGKKMKKHKEDPTKENKNRRLGEGAFGVVKLAQDLGTGDWAAFKKLKRETDWRFQRKAEEKNAQQIQQEAEGLKKAGKLLVDPYARTGGSQVRWQFITELASGPSVASIIHQENISPVFLFDLSIGILKAIKELHDKNLIHCDIKPDNIRVDLLTGQVKLVDFGLTLDLGSSTFVQTGIPIGTLGFVADEISSHAMYSRESDIYAAGKTLALCFDLVDDNYYEFLTPLRSDELEDKIHDNKELEYKRRVLKQIQQMIKSDTEGRGSIESDIKERGSIDDHIDAFEKMKANYLATHSITKRIAYLDVNAFAGQVNKEKLKEALKGMDEVWLVDKNGENKNKYTEAEHTLARMGYKVGDGVIQDMAKENLTQTLIRHSELRKELPQSNYEPNFVNKNLSVIPIDKTSVIAIDSPKIAVDFNTKYSVTKKLIDEKDRLFKKDTVGNAQTGLIQAAIEQIETKYRNKTLTYEDLHSILHKLQSDLLKRNLNPEKKKTLRSRLEPHFKFFSSSERKVVLKTIKDVKKAKTEQEKEMKRPKI